MIFGNYQSWLPFAIPSITGLVILILGGFKLKGKLLLSASLIGLAAGMASIGRLDVETPITISSFLILDHFSIFILYLLYGSVFIITLLSEVTLSDKMPAQEVFYSLFLFALSGMAVVASSNNLAAFFLGLEIYTACLYVLIAYDRGRKTSTEASIKYLIMAAVSSGFILFGIALIYLGFGSYDLTAIANQLTNSTSQMQANLWLVGSTLILAGVCFKLSMVPFHMWAPDVYQGAPTMVSAFIATASKTAVLAILVRYLALFHNESDFLPLIEVIVIASIIVGNLLALFQRNIKRLLAYSSIAHIGYAAVPLCIGTDISSTASIIYLVTYLVSVLVAFGFIVAEEGEHETSGDMSTYQGLGHVRPMRALGMALAFFSLAGIPLTAGFIGKWSIFQVAIAANRYWLAGVIILGAGIGVFYYLRVVSNMFFKPVEKETAAQPFSSTLTIGLVMAIIAIFVIGLYPEPILKHVGKATRDFRIRADDSVMVSSASDSDDTASCHD